VPAQGVLPEVNTKGWSWDAFLLPFVEEQALYDSIDFEPSLGPTGAEVIEPAVNQAAAATPVEVFLALAGTLDSTLGGPPVLPADQSASTRRSLYFFHSNNDRNRFLKMFDEALVMRAYQPL